jgi:two-component system OmpR family sensor kinase
MRSLRGRLVAILLLVALVGLLVLAAATYATQRSYLLNRLDRRLDTAFVTLYGQLRYAQQSPTNNCTGRIPVQPADEPSSGTTSGFSLPPGTYGAVVDEANKVVGECLFGFRTASGYAVPHFTLTELGTRPRTVAASGNDETEFRAATRQTADGDHLVIAVPLTDVQQTLNRLVAVEATAIVLMLAFLGTSVWVLVGISLRPLDRMGRTADAIAGSDLSQRVEPAEPRSEIGRLGLALNRMLHRLERSFDERAQSEGRLRRFLADASHELRTPLASIRGYAEIFRIGATDGGEDVARSMERIEQEATRMGVLVEDLLTLARLDETLGREHIAVDISTTARNAVADAQAAAPERRFTVDVDEGLIVDGDPHELQQMLANLLHNARVHTPAGTPVEVTARANGPVVRIDVRDHGDGLPPGAGQQIFERFWRTEGGRERGRAGSGLGLPIVAGIVAAHKGHVLAENAPDGDGALFSVWLPLAAPGQTAI